MGDFPPREIMPIELSWVDDAFSLLLAWRQQNPVSSPGQKDGPNDYLK